MLISLTNSGATLLQIVCLLHGNMEQFAHQVVQLPILKNVNYTKYKNIKEHKT